jgi:hypothetical protein
MKLQLDSGDVVEARNIRLVAGSNVGLSKSVGDNEEIIVTVEAGEADTDLAAAVAILEDADDTKVTFRRISFTETAAAGVYTGTVALPVGAILHTVAWETTAIWAADTAELDLGVTSALTRYGNDIDVSAANSGESTDLSATAGAEEYAAGTTFTAALTTVGVGGTTGRTSVYVSYSIPPTATAATKVAS